MTAVTTAPYVLLDDDGKATGRVFHTSPECKHAKDAVVAGRKADYVNDREITLLGLTQCRYCWRLTQALPPDQALIVLRKAVRDALTNIARGRPKTAAQDLQATLEYLDGKGALPNEDG